MSAVPSAAQGLAANMPYICGDLRQDHDGQAECFVVECICHQDTIKRADDNKQAAETVITTALNVVNQNAVPIVLEEWSLFAPDALQDATGKHFFAPGRLANQDLEGVE